MSVISFEQNVEKFTDAVRAFEANISESTGGAVGHAARDAWCELYEAMVCKQVEKVRFTTLEKFETVLKKCDLAFLEANVNRFEEGIKWVKRVRWYLKLLGIFKAEGPNGVHQAIEQELATLLKP